MPNFTQLLSLTLACASVAAAVVAAPPAGADPCSVPTGTAAKPAPALPSLPDLKNLPSLSKYPIFRLPIGRMPAVLKGSATSTSPSAQAVPNASAILPGPAPSASAATMVSWVNGPATNSATRFGISGADLGIVWDNGRSGAENQVLIAFGDTFGNCDLAGQEWRSNTLLRSSDRNLADGMTNPDPAFGNQFGGSPVSAARPNFAKQIIASLNLAAQEVTVIPTAAIAVGTTQYVNFMSVSQWGGPGKWSTNFSAVAMSDDNGETWTVPRSSIRPSWFNSVPGIPFVWGYQNFQMGAYLRRDGYVYAYGTTAGRGGTPFLSRVAENAVADLSAYEYFTPLGWRKDAPYLAVQVVWAPGSEMSVAWNDFLKKFVMLNTDPLSNVVMRTADKPEGPWSLAKTIVSSTAIPGGIYAPYIHPWSSGSDLYFTLSLWSTYSVMLMRTKLGSVSS
jgi:D-arabinan endo alpha-(1,5)-arabinofuranosidase